MLKEYPSLISHDESTAIKGLLMLLIVFGHTGMLTTDFATGSRTFFWNWLYSFHVYVFLILPFIYGYKKIASKVTGGGKLIDIQPVIKDLKHNVIKIGIPYCWFFMFSAIVFVTVGGGLFDLKGILYAFFFGNEPLMDKYIGFNFMWFLPAILALTILKSTYYNSNSIIKTGIIIVSLTMWGLAIFKIVTLSEVGMYIPFAVSQAFYFIIWGLTTRWLIEKLIKNKWQVFVTILMISICSILFYYSNELSWINFNVYVIVRLFMPILIFVFLYGIRDYLSRSKILKFIGKYSLQIYLVHVYILNMFDLFFSYFIEPNWGWGLVIYVLTLLLSSYLSVTIVRITAINMTLFPKGK